jgi:hypothetical protein
MEFLEILLEKIKKNSVSHSMASKEDLERHSQKHFSPSQNKTHDDFAPGYSWLFAQPLKPNLRETNPAAHKLTCDPLPPLKDFNTGPSSCGTSEANLYTKASRGQKKPTQPGLKPATTTPPPRRPHVLNDNQKLAFKFFASKGAILDAGFTRSELKSAWRKLALKTHPDISGQGEAEFRVAKRCYQELEKLFNS